MIVQCLGFGTFWWTRFAKDSRTGEYSRAHSAIFNSTGFRVGTKKIHKWVVRGYVRLNCNSLPLSWGPADLSGRNFSSPGITQYRNTNRLLLGRPVGDRSIPNFVLFSFDSSIHGQIDFQGRWRSGDVRLISFSSRNGCQEFLLLMPVGGRISTSLGIWEVVCQKRESIWSCKITLSSHYDQTDSLG